MKLRGALLGAGNIALRSHAPQWMRDEALSREVEIVAVADLAETNLVAMREVLPRARAYGGAEELMKHEALDFVDICTPPFTHRSLIVRAAALGLHIVCEKPLAITREDADAIVRCVRAANIVFTPCHQYHHAPQWQAIRALLPQIGRLRFVEYEVLRSVANPGNPHWMPEWRTRSDLAGGGILVDHGTHILYQLRSALGPPRAVHATVSRRRHRSYEVEDTAAMVLDYGDSQARVRLTWASRRRAIRFRFVGELGEIVGDDRRVVLHAQRREELRFEDGLSKNSSHAEWYAPMLRSFVARVKDGTRDYAELEEAVDVMRMIDLAYASARSGRAMPFGPDAAPEEITALEDGSVTIETPASAEPGDVSQPVAAGDIAHAQGWKRRLFAVARAGALLGIGVGVAIVLRNVNWHDFWRAIAGSDTRWLALAAAVNLVVIGFAATRWVALLRPLAPMSRWWDAFNALVVGLAVSTVVPARAGEVARMRWLHRRTGLSQVAILGSIGLDQLLNVTGLMVGLALLPWMGGLPLWLRHSAQFAFLLFTAAVVTVILLRPLASHGPSEAPARSGPDGPRFVGRIREGLSALRNPRALGRSFVASLIVWTLEVVVLRLALRAVGIVLPLSASLVVLAAVNLMLSIPVAPANLGALEIGAMLSLKSFGIAGEQALAFAVCYHALQIVPIAMLGLIIAGFDKLPLAAVAIEWGG